MSPWKRDHVKRTWIIFQIIKIFNRYVRFHGGYPEKKVGGYYVLTHTKGVHQAWLAFCYATKQRPFFQRFSPQKSPIGRKSNNSEKVSLRSGELSKAYGWSGCWWAIFQPQILGHDPPSSYQLRKNVWKNILRLFLLQASSKPLGNF